MVAPGVGCSCPPAGRGQGSCDVQARPAAQKGCVPHSQSFRYLPRSRSLFHPKTQAFLQN